MAVLKFLGKLLNTPKVPAKKATVKIPYYFDEPTGYYTVRGEGFDSAYSSWQKTKTLSPDQLHAIGAHAIAANLDNRSGYVREFCLMALALIDGAEAFKAVALRLNDYVPSNRELALQLTLKWLAELPLETLIDALPELDSLEEQSRANHAAVYGALAQRLGAADGREALVSGLINHRAKVRRACWKRCMQTLTWSGTERIQFAMHCGDPAIARSVEKDVFALPDEELIDWFSKLSQVRAMPLRRAFLVALRRKALVDSQQLISAALWDDSFSIRWLGRHWGKDAPEDLLQQYVDTLHGEGISRRKCYALEGLAQLKLSGGLQACKNALQNPTPVIRKAALSAACAVDTVNQSTYVADAIQDADMSVVMNVE